MNELHERQAELAKMDMSILKAKNVLASLKEESEAYLSAREEEAEKRVIEVLEASKSTLDTASSHFKQVEKMRQEVENVVQELTKYQEDLMVQREAFLKHVKEEGEKLKQRVADLTAYEEACKAAQKQVNAEWARLQVEHQEISEQKAYVKDQRARLSAAMKEYGRRKTR